MKRPIYFLILISALGRLNAQEYHTFRTSHTPGFSIENSSTSGLSLHYSINELGIAYIDNGEAQGHELILKGSFGSFAEGKPNLPAENRYIAVPKGATVSIEVKERASASFNGIELLPAAEAQLNRDPGLPKLQKDMEIFGKDANFPEKCVSIVQTTQIRKLDVVLLSVTPFRYNPIRKTLEVVYDMDIEVRFEGGNGQFGDVSYLNPDWDHILRDLVINSDMIPEAHYYDFLNEAIRRGAEGCEYLIIAPDDDDILAWADTLKEFRTKQGILTKVVSVTECGGNEPETIKNYIKNAYENWAIHPSAVMIFGGLQDTIVDDYNIYPNKGIFGFPLMFYGYTYDNGYQMDFSYISDNPYVDMNDDSIPDMAISRLPAYQLDHYRSQIKKLISYETNPPSIPQFYDHPIITSGFVSNKWFMITSQIFNGFCRDKLGKHPTNLYNVYDYEYPTQPDSLWSTGYNTPAVMEYFGPGGENYISGSITELENWISSQDVHLLIEAFNRESFFTLYRDHSSYETWCCPRFTTYNIYSLQNTFPTYIFSIGCDTGCYEEYYDTPFNMLPHFCNEPVGALGGIGAVCVTRSQYNDILTWGMIDYIWPEFMPTLGSTRNPGFVRPTYGLLAGKLFLSQNVFMPNYSHWQSYLTDTYNVFHSLGEAYLNLYTETPQPIAIDAPRFHPDNQWEYSFTVEEGTTVCFSKDNEILIVTQGTGRPQSIILPPMAVGEQITLIATKQNRFRLQDEITIISANQAYTYLKKAQIQDQDGNGRIDYNENIWFDLDLRNAGFVASEGGDLTLECESPYIEILKGMTHYSHLDPDATMVIENAFHFKVDKDIPDQTPLHFKVHFNDGENTHTEHLDFIANAPSLSIRAEYSITDADGNPSTHLLTDGLSLLSFTIDNSGNSKSKALLSQMELKAPFLQTDSTYLVNDGIERNSSLTITFPIVADGTEPIGAWPRALLRIQHMDTELLLDTLIQYGGLFESFETDTLNPSFNWSFLPNNGDSWSYCDDAYDGQRSLRIHTDDHRSFTMNVTSKGSELVNHDSKTSFRYKSNKSSCLRFDNHTTESIPLAKSEEWKYCEAISYHKHSRVTWKLISLDPVGDTLIAELDDLWFPPRHRGVAHAGDDLVSCGATSVAILDAYAYDCDSVYWTTDGDGYFEDKTMVNPIYVPGNQDIDDGEVVLTLHAVSASDTINSATQIHFVDNLSLGNIVGDSVVNKYQELVSRYAVENQEGMNYIWQLEPAEMGFIYSHGSTTDIVWNLCEGDAEVMLSVTADNGCEVEPITKTISLIGYSTPEWTSVSFDLFPNPTDGKVNLVINENWQGRAIVEVYNLLGERMMVKNIHNMQKGEALSLDLSHLVSGLYIIKLSTENGSCTKKVSVK